MENWELLQKAKLFFKKWTGIANGEEEETWKELLAKNPGYQRLWEDLCHWENYEVRRKKIEGINVEEELLRVMNRRKKRLLVPAWGRLAIAATFVLTAATGLYFFMNPNRGEMEVQQMTNAINCGGKGAVLILSDGTSTRLSDSVDCIAELDGSEIKTNAKGLNYSGIPSSEEKTIYNKLIVGRGYEYMLVLNDGTKVWMNSDSELDYPVVFGEDTRRVKLSGEAYFEVTPDSKRAFIVEVVKGFEVKVLGTRFNVKAYNTDSFCATTLVSGRVQVTEGNGKQVILKPSEQMIMKENGEIELKTINPGYYTAWHDGWFFFENEPLEQVFVMIGRWYDVDFDVLDEEVGQRMVTGKLKRFENLNVILEMLEKMSGVEFKINGKLIEVKHNRK
ncbi:MAG: DUF4974 domain-containing protein [Odoribacter sp.]